MIQEIELFLASLIKLWWIFVLMGSAGVLINQIRIHHKVLYSKEGNLRVMTTDDRKEMEKKEQERFTIFVREIKEKIDSIKFSRCSDHESKMSLLGKVENRQGVNVEKLDTIDTALQAGAEDRADMSKKLTSICVHIATISADIGHMKNDIMELKERRSFQREAE